jgi:hypothetical protein
MHKCVVSPPHAFVASSASWASREPKLCTRCWLLSQRELPRWRPLPARAPPGGRSDAGLGGSVAERSTQRRSDDPRMTTVTRTPPLPLLFHRPPLPLLFPSLLLPLSYMAKTAVLRSTRLISATNQRQQPAAHTRVDIVVASACSGFASRCESGQPVLVLYSGGLCGLR